MEKKKIVRLRLSELEMELILDALDLFYTSVEEYIEEMLEEKKEEDIETYITGLKLKVAEDLPALIVKMKSAKKMMEME